MSLTKPQNCWRSFALITGRRETTKALGCWKEKRYGLHWLRVVALEWCLWIPFAFLPTCNLSRWALITWGNSTLQQASAPACLVVEAWCFRYNEKPRPGVLVVPETRDCLKLLLGTNSCHDRHPILCCIRHVIDSGNDHLVQQGRSASLAETDLRARLFLAVLQANSEEFIPVFANNSRELKAFLEHMTEVQADSPQGVYDTLLELRLQNWAHEQDEQVWAPPALCFERDVWCLWIRFAFLPALNLSRWALVTWGNTYAVLDKWHINGKAAR